MTGLLTVAMSAPTESSALVASSGAESARRAAVLTAVILIMTSLAAKAAIDTAQGQGASDIADAVGDETVQNTVPSLGTVCYGFGKVTAFLLGAQRIGDRRYLVVIMLLGGTFTYLFTIGTNAAFFSAWMAYRYVTAFAWPVSVSLMLLWVDLEHHGKATGALGYAWEGSAALMAGVFTSLPAEEWEVPFYIAGACAFASAILVAAFLHTSATAAGHRPPHVAQPLEPLTNRRGDVYRTRGDEVAASAGRDPAKAELAAPLAPSALPPQAHPLDGATLWEAVVAFAHDGSFWLALAGNTALLGASYMKDYQPSLLHDWGKADETERKLLVMSNAAVNVVGLAVGGVVRDHCSRRGWMRVVCVLCVWATAMQWAMQARAWGGELSARDVYVFQGLTQLATVTLGYILVTVFVAEIGGLRHAATALNLVDMVGIGFSAITQAVCGALDNDRRYVDVLLLGPIITTIGCAAWALYACRVLWLLDRATLDREVEASSGK